MKVMENELPITKFLILFLIVSNLGFSQSKNEPIIFRNKIEKQKSFRITKFMQTVEIDTTVVVKTNDTLNFLNDFKYFDDEALFKSYVNYVFSNRNTTIQQFIVPVLIYLDSKIPDNISTEYKKFVNSIPKIDNLNISFTNKKEDANYLLSVSEKDFFGISKKDLEKFNKQDYNKLVFLKMFASLSNDQNGNLYAYHLKISPSILKNKNTLNKLKKAFFKSLGNFSTLIYGAPKGSTLDFETTEIDDLIDEDIQVLKMHYHYIYNFRINARNFYNLYYNYKQKKI